MLGRCQLALGHGRFPTALRASLQCCIQSSTGAFHDQLPLHLGKARHHMEEEATGWSARVDAVSDAHEVHAVPLKAAHKIDELLDAAAEPVELPDDECVAIPELVERLEESRAVGDLSARRVLVEPFAPCPAERLTLHVQTLVVRRVITESCGSPISRRARRTLQVDTNQRVRWRVAGGEGYANVEASP